jgi:hypothetical protein
LTDSHLQGEEKHHKLGSRSNQGHYLGFLLTHGLRWLLGLLILMLIRLEWGLKMKKITCKKLNAIVSKKTCIARQQLIENQFKPVSAGWGNSGEKLDLYHCMGCERGIKLFEKAKESGDTVVFERPASALRRRTPEEINHAWLSRKFSTVEVW